MCISEIWVSSNENLTLYQLHGYSTFGDCRRTRRGGGVIICVKQSLQPLQCAEPECHDVFSICSVKLLRCSTPTIVIAAYRPPDSSIQETQLFFDKLNYIFEANRQYTSFILVGDFNIVRDWSVPILPDHDGAAGLLGDFILDNDLSQLVLQPTRGDHILDLALVTDNLASSVVQMAPPVAGSDHTAQVIFLPMISRRLKQRTRASVMKTDYEAMRQILNSISWRELFSLCNDVDDYVNVFMDVIVSAKGRASYSCRRRPGSINFPPAILSLIYKKRHLWYKSQKSGDRTQYYDARNKCRQAIKKFSADYEKSVINSGNFKSFYKYMNLKLGRSKNATESMGIGSHSASESAEIFSAEFTRNFSAREPIDVDKVMREAEDTGLRLNCSFDDVTTALKQCANSAAGQDGISFKLIKELSKQLLPPL